MSNSTTQGMKIVLGYHDLCARVDGLWRRVDCPPAKPRGQYRCKVCHGTDRGEKGGVWPVSHYTSELRPHPALAGLSGKAILQILRRHPLVKFDRPVSRVFVVGSMATGAYRDDSDIDVMLEIAPVYGSSPEQVAETYRTKLRNYFVRHSIRGKCDEVHPQLLGRRCDLYLTYNADEDVLPKIEIPIN